MLYIEFLFVVLFVPKCGIFNNEYFCKDYINKLMCAININNCFISKFEYVTIAILDPIITYPKTEL